MTQALFFNNSFKNFRSTEKNHWLTSKTKKQKKLEI